MPFDIWIMVALVGIGVAMGVLTMENIRLRNEIRYLRQQVAALAVVVSTVREEVQHNGNS